MLKHSIGWIWNHHCPFTKKKLLNHTTPSTLTVARPKGVTKLQPTEAEMKWREKKNIKSPYIYKDSPLKWFSTVDGLLIFYGGPFILLYFCVRWYLISFFLALSASCFSHSIFILKEIRTQYCTHTKYVFRPAQWGYKGQQRARPYAKVFLALELSFRHLHRM